MPTEYKILIVSILLAIVLLYTGYGRHSDCDSKGGVLLRGIGEFSYTCYDKGSLVRIPVTTIGL